MIYNSVAKYNERGETMTADLQKAKEILTQNNLTCVLCKGDSLYISDKRGVAPLLAWLESGESFDGFSCADKVVGNGAAYLYVLLGVSEIHALVVSKSARCTLELHGIACTFDKEVDAIINRTGDGPCPMESAVSGAKTAEEAYTAIKNKLEQMKKLP